METVSMLGLSSQRARDPARPLMRRRKHWGWGFEDEQPSRGELRARRPGLAEHLGFGDGERRGAGRRSTRSTLPAPRLAAPAALARALRDDAHARASHA